MSAHTLCCYSSWGSPSSRTLTAGRFHAGGYFHNAEFFHYYLNARYFDELGYDGLYGAALQADLEDPAPAFGFIKTTRDLRSAQEVPADWVRGDPSFRERFSDSRWQDFRRDLTFFKPHSNQQTWEQSLRDHGYNAPPTLTVVLSGVTRLFGPATAFSIHALALLDVLLLAVACWFVKRTYGFEVAALGAILIATDLSGYDWIGGSPLRYSWLFLSIFGVVALERDRFGWAGFLLGSAALLRLFPLFFALGVVLQGLSRCVRTRELDPRLVSFTAGLSLSAAVLVGASLIELGGIDTWEHYAEKIRLHARMDYVNNVGLRGLVGVGSLLFTGQLLLAGVYVACLARVTKSQAAILGILLIYAFTPLASYYYGLLVLFLLWRVPPDGDPLPERLPVMVLGIQALTLAVRLASDAELPIYDSRIYLSMSAAVLVHLLVPAAHILRPRRPNPVQPAMFVTD